jgi:glutathione peroxidase-family protein
MSKTAYDVKIADAGGTTDDLLADREGEVTLFFNASGACGNDPQFAILQALHDEFKDDGFAVICVPVDNFQCHARGPEDAVYSEEGEPGNTEGKNVNFAKVTTEDIEYRRGLKEISERTGLSRGEVCRQYAEMAYSTDYAFTECVEGRYDDCRYEPEWVPNSQVDHEMHDLWQVLCRTHAAPVGPTGVPIANEKNQFAEDPQMTVDGIDIGQGYSPLQGNFEKFLVDRSGRSMFRYHNGFLMGERDASGRSLADPELMGETGTRCKSAYDLLADDIRLLLTESK